MPEFIFLDKNSKPGKADVANTLKNSNVYLEEIFCWIKDNYGNFTEEWKYYSPKSGWTLKVLLGKRNLFFTIPLAEQFLIAFAFGDKAVATVEKSDLPADLIKELRDTRKYAEGRGLRIYVKSKEQVETIKKLISIKVAN